MKIFEIILLFIMIICALAVCLTKKLLTSIIIFMCFSLVLSIVWVMMQAPDLAITEAAVGAGISSILFFAALKQMDCLKEDDDETV